MTYRLPSLNALRAFESAARHLSFKMAASELGVTAGAVSQQVKKLEGSLTLAESEPDDPATRNIHSSIRLIRDTSG